MVRFWKKPVESFHSTANKSRDFEVVQRSLGVRTTIQDNAWDIVRRYFRTYPVLSGNTYKFSRKAQRNKVEEYLLGVNLELDNSHEL